MRRHIAHQVIMEHTKRVLLFCALLCPCQVFLEPEITNLCLLWNSSINVVTDSKVLNISIKNKRNWWKSKQKFMKLQLTWEREGVTGNIDTVRHLMYWPALFLSWSVGHVGLPLWELREIVVNYEGFEIWIEWKIPIFPRFQMFFFLRTQTFII